MENARIEQESFQRMTAPHRREYPEESSDDASSDRRTYGGRRPQKKEDVMVSMGGHLIEGDMGMEFTLGEGMQIEVEDPLMMHGP